MPPKKNRLDDARRRLNEKLESIKEQSEYITQTLTTTVSNATQPACELLNLQDKKKFFHKYSQVSQDLEKCLDFLLALGDTVDAFDENDSDTGSDDVADSVDKDDQKENDQSKTRIAAKFTSDPGSVKASSTPAEGKKEVVANKQESSTTQCVNTDISNHGDHQVNTNNDSNHGNNETLKTGQEKVFKTKAEQDESLQDKQKQFTSIAFEDILSQEVDMERVKTMDTIIPWVTKRITELLLGVKDDVVLEFIEKMLESKKPDPQLMQITLTGFLQAKNARIFMGELWERLISAQNKCPSQLIEKNAPEREQTTKDKATLEKDHIKDDGSSKVPISVQGNDFRVPSQLMEKKTAERGQATNETLRKDDITNYDSSTLKMPKAFTQKGIKKDRNQDKRGRRSPSTHVKEERNPVLKVVQLKPYPFKSGKCLEVVVTEVLSPWELWIQPADNGFNLLMEKMCLHFAKAAASGHKGGLTVPPSVGEYCCARFMDDDTWYRVVVIGIHQSCDKPNQGQGRQRKSSTGSTSSTSSIDNHYPGLEIDVLCIDDGSRDRLPLSRLRRLDSTLADIPCQALCCALNGVQPLVKNPVKSQGDSLWKEESIEWLRNKVSGVKLLAYPKRTDDEALIMVDLYLTNKKKQGPGSTMPGKDGTLPGLQYSIAHIMVLEGFAQHVGHVTASPANSKASSPQSVISEEHSSRRSSLSVTSLQEDDKLVFDKNVTQEQGAEVSKCVSKGTVVTQKDTKVLQEKHVAAKGKVTTKKTTDKRPSTNAVTNTPQERHFIKGKDDVRNVTQGQGVTKDKERSTNSIDTKISNDTVTVSKLTDQPSDTDNIVQDEPLDIDRKQSPEVTHQESHDSVTQDEDRASPRYPPEGSSHTESIKDLADSIQHQDQPLLLQVMMSEVINPSEFYVHLVTPEAVLLAELTEDLDSYYKDSDVKSMPKDYRLSVGDYCCAKFSKDSMWCRAKVLDVQVSPSGDGDSELVANIYVFYVDYGNSEWVAMGDTRPLLAKFMMLPGFAVKTRLAGVQPAVIQDNAEVPPSANEVPNEQKDLVDEQDPGKNPVDVKDEGFSCAKPNESNTKQPLQPQRKVTRGKRGKKNKKLPLHDRNVVLRAAGDESGDSELSDGGLIFDSVKNERKEDMKAKEVEESALPEMYLVASPDKTQSPDITSTITRKPEWTEEAVELFKGLTGDDKPLRGIMVPWNSTTYQLIYYPAASCSSVDITYQRPPLVLQLYDTTGDEDIDITQIMVETGLAELVDDDEGGKINQENVSRVLHLSVNDLENTADQLDKEGKNQSPLLHSDSEEDEDMMKLFNPMMEDFKSSRNAYGIDTNDLDIAIHGFKPIETQYCKFYRSAKTRCWRGENCPMLHVKEGEDATVRVQAFCNNNDFTVDLPKVNSWIGVRVTAVVNPGHFWVQFPCGSGPIEKKIIEERLGLTIKEDVEEEDFDAMSERMNKFYTRNIFRESTTILPAPGELVAAKYTQNDQWYRACVLDVTDEAIKVSFVDYGNTEWTAAANVKRMLPQFLHMPFQAVECFLGNIEPKENGDWTQESINVFESLTQDKLLIAHVLSISWNNTMWMELFDTQNEPEININEQMIKQGFACESQVKITIPPSPRSLSTGSPDTSDCEIVFIPG